MDASGFKELHQVVSTHCAKAREYPTGRECNCPIGDPANGGSILNWPVHQTCSEHQIVFANKTAAVAPVCTPTASLPSIWIIDRESRGPSDVGRRRPLLRGRSWSNVSACLMLEPKKSSIFHDPRQ